MKELKFASIDDGLQYLADLVGKKIMIAGGTTFEEIVEGKSARDAFDKAVKQARFEYGHGGYTGSIAEKDGFVMLKVPADEDKDDFIERMLDDHPEVSDKWGKAGCIDLGGGKYQFFGWASS